MTAKEYLSQAYRLDQRIQSKKKLITLLENLATNCTTTLTGMPHNPSPAISPMADAISKIVDMKNELRDELVLLLNCQTHLLKTIHGVKNLEYQLLLEKRYLCYQPWDEIAYDFNYSVSWILKLHRKALDAIDEIAANNTEEHDELE